MALNGMMACRQSSSLYRRDSYVRLVDRVVEFFFKIGRIVPALPNTACRTLVEVVQILTRGREAHAVLTQLRKHVDEREAS
jgi:hypothetical protein